MINKATNKEIVAVVDPPRGGLREYLKPFFLSNIFFLLLMVETISDQKAIIQLRRSKIQKLIYLSCNPKAALKNFITFGKLPSKTLFGCPFLPVKAIPVDNFPHTNHCELILYFERFDSDNIDSHSNDVSS